MEVVRDDDVVVRTKRRASAVNNCSLDRSALGANELSKCVVAAITSGTSSTASTCSAGSMVADDDVSPVPTPRNNARFGAG
jgi:hypothetical protein